MNTPASDQAILGARLEELEESARTIREEAHGSTITYSPKVFIPLTQLCRDRCGYCTFAKAPARLAAPYMTPAEVLQVAKAGKAAGCSEALFTLGQSPEDRYPAARDWLDSNGYASTVDYLAAMCRLVVDETNLLPHANAGAISYDDLTLLRRVTASQGMMIETLDGELQAHHGAPDKDPAVRLATLAAAGRATVPFTTGLLVGIGESRQSRLAALRSIAGSHREYGHVQEVIVQGFLPKPGTAMRGAPPCTEEELRWTIAAARVILPGEVHVQSPPNLTDSHAGLLRAGIDDWGGVSPVTIDHVNPERPWAEVEFLRRTTESEGFELAPRLTVYPAYAGDPERWLDPAMRFAVLANSDAAQYARSDHWSPGSGLLPPALVPPHVVPTAPGAPARSALAARSPTRSAPTNSAPALAVPSAPALPAPAVTHRRVRGHGHIREVLAGVAMGQRADAPELLTLFGARGQDLRAVIELADDLRSTDVGDAVTYVVNRNINYTNICTFKCRFCAFSKGPLSLNLRGEPYLLSLDDITEKVRQAEVAGATEVCLQGGIHPSFDGNYYVEVLDAVRRGSPTIHIHAFSALEVHEGARRCGLDLTEYLLLLKEHGLSTLPGTAAEILSDDVRAVLCPDKIRTAEWLEVHQVAHSIGLRSNITIMFGSVEQPRHWVGHILATRALQGETGGFTEFVPLPYVHMGAPLYLQGRSRQGPTFRETLLMYAVGRIAYRGYIDNVQASWVKLGVEGARQTLLAGANDLGGTLMEESISRAAGAVHGQAFDIDDFLAITDPIGRPLRQRTTLYKVPSAAA